MVKSLVLLLTVGLFVADSYAQELTPRAYWPAPKGTKLLVSGYSYSEGDVLFDPSVPLYDVDSAINVAVLAYLQTVSLWGRSSNILVEVPYTWGVSEGYVGEIPAKRNFAGFGDIGFTMTVNLMGAPTMSIEDFQNFRAAPHTIVGASLKVLLPTGHYEDDRLINVGANRWAVRAKLGTVIPIRPKWLVELTASAWFFEDDDDFLPGVRQQDPVYAAQANLIRRFRPGFWASLDCTYFLGGRQTIGENELGDVQGNVKIGGTLVVPFAGRHAIKLGYANGAVTKYGNDFDQLLISYQVLLN